MVAAVAAWAANQVLLRSFPAAPPPAHLLFVLPPYVSPARWLTVVALAAGIGVYLWATWRAAPSTLPAAATAVALMYLLRAGMIVLTPLAPAYGEGIFVFPQEQFGTFPSGHTALLTLLALRVPDDRPRLRLFQWAMVALMVAGLLLAHGHYSIDIIGGLLLAYFVATVWRHGRLFSPITRVTGP